MFVPQWTSVALGIILLIYCIYCAIANKGEKTAGRLAIGVYLIVFVAMYIISLKTPILYARYFLNLTGLFIFFMAFFYCKG